MSHGDHCKVVASFPGPLDFRLHKEQAMKSCAGRLVNLLLQCNACWLVKKIDAFSQVTL